MAPLAGGVAMPVVGSIRVGRSGLVAIVDSPDARTMAQSGVTYTYAPGPNQFHSSARADRHFDFPGAAGTERPAPCPPPPKAYFSCPVRTWPASR